VLQRRVSIGMPQVRRLSAEDPALTDEDRRFVASSTAAYFLVKFAASLAGGEGERLAEARFGVELADPGLAWSLAPLRLAGDRGDSGFSVNGEVNLIAGLKIGGSWAPPADREVCWVYALGEQEPDPEWRLQSVPNHVIDGPHQVAMVAQGRCGVPASGSVRLTARFERSGFTFRCRAKLPRAAEEFTLA